MTLIAALLVIISFPLSPFPFSPSLSSLTPLPLPSLATTLALTSLRNSGRGSGRSGSCNGSVGRCKDGSCGSWTLRRRSRSSRCSSGCVLHKLTILPESFKSRAVLINNLAITRTSILYVFPNENCSRSPSVCAISIKSSILKASLVAISITEMIQAMSIFSIVFEIALIKGSIRPGVCSVPMFKTVLETSDVCSSMSVPFQKWISMKRPGRPHLRISRYQQRISEIFLSLISVKSFASSRVRTADLESHSPLLYHRAMQNCCETKLLKTLNKLSLNSQGSQGPEFFF